MSSLTSLNNLQKADFFLKLDRERIINTSAVWSENKKCKRVQEKKEQQIPWTNLQQTPLTSPDIWQQCLLNP